MPAPTRPLYAAVAERVGREVVEIPLTRGFDVDVASLIAAGQSGQIALIIIGAPNDPTGTSITATDVVRLLRTEIPIVVDESLFEF